MLNNTLSIYGSHDAAATYIDKTGKIKVLEYERFVRLRYAMFSNKFDGWEGTGTDQRSRELFLSYIKQDLYDNDIKTVYYNELSDTDLNLISKYFPGGNFIKVGHHTAHAASGYYTSPFDDALIISIDGGGAELDGIAMTVIFKASNNEINSLGSIPIDFGNPYGGIGFPISEIKPGPDSIFRSLVYAGKVMGLCAYGEVREDWLNPIREYFGNSGSNRYGSDIEALGSKLIGIPFTLNCLEGKDSYDLAATSQYVFEEMFFDVFWRKIKNNNLDVILVGGCALNVLLNQRLSEELEKIGKKLFVPSNPNDSGLSLGQFLYHNKHKIKDDVVYNGFEILDESDFEMFKEQYSATICGVSDIVDLVKDGKIIGIIDGGSEIGPRALGNRSIICDPSRKDMKDILNAKVKFREWFRPFAPVCRYEDKDIYFDKVYESKYMSFAPIVKEEYKTKLSSITHEDGTARLQTVRKGQHELFYDILTEMKERDLTAVILNTSFNIKGLPILTTIKDALYVLDNTELDYVYCKGYLFKKK